MLHNVNLSVRSVERDGVLEDIGYFLKKYDLDSSYLEVEVTETVFGKDSERIKRNLEGIKSLGITLSLDDFSAGHSSAKYLLDFSFDVVKLDMSLLPTDEGEVSKKKIYETLVEMIKTLGMTSVAEGVETVYQEKLLEEMGVTVGQGYYYNKPLPAREIEKILEKRIV